MHIAFIFKKKQKKNTHIKHISQRYLRLCEITRLCRLCCLCALITFLLLGISFVSLLTALTGMQFCKHLLLKLKMLPEHCRRKSSGGRKNTNMFALMSFIHQRRIHCACLFMMKRIWRGFWAKSSSGELLLVGWSRRRWRRPRKQLLVTLDGNTTGRSRWDSVWNLCLLTVESLLCFVVLKCTFF